MLREFEVDIAVDLDGYGEDGRPGIFAARPAPIQVNFGYPATMGAEFIDYIVADRTVLPFDQQKLVTEKIVHLPDCHQATDKKPESAPELPSREAVGLPATGFVFCCFAESFKIARPVFDVWMRLLSRNAGSVLWLSRGSDAACERLRNEATARGIDPARLVFAEPVPRAEHLSRHRLADVFLDTLPFSAAAASDALWAGVPVVTCKGNAFAARIGASLVTAAGHYDLIAADLAGYEAQALQLAAEPEWLAARKRRLDEERAGGAPVRHRSVPPPRGSGLCQDVRAAAQQHPAAKLCRDRGMTRQCGTMPTFRTAEATPKGNATREPATLEFFGNDPPPGVRRGDHT